MSPASWPSAPARRGPASRRPRGSRSRRKRSKKLTSYFLLLHFSLSLQRPRARCGWGHQEINYFKKIGLIFCRSGACQPGSIDHCPSELSFISSSELMHHLHVPFSFLHLFLGSMLLLPFPRAGIATAMSCRQPLGEFHRRPKCCHHAGDGRSGSLLRGCSGPYFRAAVGGRVELRQIARLLPAFS